MAPRGQQQPLVRRRRGAPEAPPGRAELLANPAIRAQIFAGSIQTPDGLTNFD